MPVLSSALAAVVREAIPGSSFFIAFDKALAAHPNVALHNKLRSADRRLLRFLLQRRDDGMAYANPYLIAQQMGWGAPAVRASLARLKRYSLLPFRVRA